MKGSTEVALVRSISTSQTDDSGEQRPAATNIRGEKVSLGPLERELLPTYQRWLNDFELLKLIDRRFRPLSADWISTWYERSTRDNQDTMIFTIWEGSTETPIGNVALQDIDYRNRTAELGIFIAETPTRGQGYGTEATKLILDLAFRILGLQNVMLRVYDYNEPARRCYERAGFREFGRRRQSQFMDGRFWTVIYMECLATDFLSPQPPRDC